jgi:hypothetical protein
MESVIVVASHKNWKVSTLVLEESSVASLTHDDVQIAYADNAYDVLSSCPENIAVNLRSQLIQHEIDKAGGITKYKEQVYKNQLKYGVNCYNYLDVETLRAFAEAGIYLSNKV